ncbi:sulfite exporter TauE/SafE family protein [Bacillus sp. FJAT-45350]|uniref:sulfite exporter TauE/SafE family protein n=1 Tax=Bacillus sp. FJAT-45350 TaxID=2011014 RepID=UPI000BB90AEA|nr:sulfite exporter TauE/SafE family protein [Bacillus sp. FJAT-45350]
MLLVFVLILIVVGLASGMLGSLVGIGGGMVIVPSLLYLGLFSISPLFSEVTPQVAVGTSLLVILVIGLSSTFAYLKQKTVDYKSGWMLFIGSGPGAIVGAWLNRFLSSEQFSLYFGIFIICIAILMMVRNYLKPVVIRKTFLYTAIGDNGDEVTYGYNVPVMLVISFSIGILAGLFGIGGGVLMVPVMILLFNFPTRIAVATSMLVIFLSAITGSITHMVLGNINWTYAGCLVVGAWFGAKIGAYLNNKLKAEYVLAIFRFVLLFVGIGLTIN